jgi:hypothetical protein
MKPLSRNEPLDADVSGTTQFEGRTAEEAVARARAALGDDGALRCWKTRRGGVGGFFAKEVFVAGLTPPPGSETTRSKASRAERGEARGGPNRAPGSGAAPYDGTTRAAGQVRRGSKDKSVGPEDHLSGLVEATSDQVSLRSLAIPAEAFDEVLAEAQAALTREREANGVTVPPTLEDSLPQTFATEEPGVSEQEPALHDDGDVGVPPDLRETATAASTPQSPDGRAPAQPPSAKKTSRPKPKEGRATRASRATTAPMHEQRGRGARMPDLRSGLRSVGVPNSYLPRGPRPSLDQLADVMGTLPVPRALPTRSGAVVAVVGSEANLDRTVDLLTAELSLAQRDVLRSGGSPGRQIARRRASGRTSLLAVDAGPGVPFGSDVRGLLQQVAPDYVLAAVDAHCKRADVEHWVGELPAVDALALWDLSGTRTPAELLGVLPIAFVDGEPSSPLAWTLILARRAMGHGGR